MMEKPKPPKKCPPRNIFDVGKDMFLHAPCASATEYTGLAPTVPETEYEAESIADILDVPVTARDGSEAYKKRV